MWIGGAVNNHFAFIHDLAIVHQHLLLFRDQEFVCFAVEVGNNKTLLTFRVFTERNRTSNVGKHAGIFWRTGFEQFGNAWQTAGDIACLLRFLWNTRQNFTDLHLLAITHGNECADWKRDVHRVIGAGDLNFFASFADQFDLWAHRDFATARLRRNHHQCRQARDIVNLLGNRAALFNVFEANSARVF